jgi:Undecaprenyl-phosphate glucose phosphotransferase
MKSSTLHEVPARTKQPAKLAGRRFHPPAGSANLMTLGLMGSMVALDVITALAVMVAIDTIYHLGAYGVTVSLAGTGARAIAFAAAFALVHAVQHGYAPTKVRAVGLGRIGASWTIAISLILIVAFLGKISDFYPRGSTLIFLMMGPFAIHAARQRFLQRLERNERLSGFFHRRVLIVGTPDRIARIERLIEARGEYHLVAAFSLRMEEDGGSAEGDFHAAQQDVTERQREDMMLATSMTRLFSPDDVIIALPLQDPALINWCVGRLITVPAAIHIALDELSPEPLLMPARASLDDHLMRVTAKPMPLFSSLCKRAFDILGASFGLLLLSPLMLLIALAIKLDSPGPALFTQTRYGFNLVGFKILKFRTMHTMEDGRHVRQAVAGDPRITRVGRFLRRWNLDELPQIVNVLLGTMSLVGPRPHAMAHDQEYFQTLAQYARRHNVRPGITGWAQVNGYRGEIADEEALTNRLAHDLHYIDHWNPWLDIRIVFLTVFSRKAYRNAR